MSLVGPRPLTVDEDNQITGLDRRRLFLTPGRTGHWQIAGSSRVWWSLWTDVKILMRTALLVAARRGI